MERHQVIQNLLNLFDSPSYLEIGVDKGHTFHSLEAGSKVAVDPCFSFDLAAERSNPKNENCVYHQMTSDGFFYELDTARKFDVIFIDGLHTFEQTLRDLINSINALSQKGVIIIDDVIPASYAASLPDLNRSRQFWDVTSNPDGSWMGDVYKVILFINQIVRFLDYSTVQENHGQTVVWKSRRDVTDHAFEKVDSICRADYADLMLNLNVMKIRRFEDIFTDIIRAHT